MTTYIALLRGVNVGGNNKVPMADLRTALEADGFTRVRTYIQSGNVLVDASRTSTHKVGARVHDVIDASFGVDVATITIDVEHLADVVRRNPYPDESNHKLLHAFFLPAVPDEAAAEKLRSVQDAYAAKGGSDTITIDGPTLYLHTPDGFGTSELAKALTTKGRIDKLNGTARNWATVTTLLAMAQG